VQNVHQSAKFLHQLSPLAAEMFLVKMGEMMGSKDRFTFHIWILKKLQKKSVC